MSKRYSLLLSSVLLLFILLYGMLCFFSRLATDDYYFIWDVRNHGIVTGVTSQYLAWCGRFSATFFMDLFYKCFDVNQTFYFLLPLTSLILLVSGVYYFLSTLLTNYNQNIPSFQKWLLSFSFVALLFFLSFDIAESWFWYCGLSSYLWSIIAFVWGMTFLIDNRKTVLTTSASILCFIYVGGASEVYSVIFGLALTALLIYNYRKQENLKSFLANTFNKKLIVIYAVLGISFIIFLIAPGNYLRDGLFPEHKIFNSFFIAGKSVVKFVVFYFPFKIPYIIVFSSPFFLLGNYLKSNKIDSLSLTFKQFFIRMKIFFGILFLIFFLVVAYVMVETGPPRVSFILSFLLSIYCIVIFFYAGYRNVFHSKNFKFLQCASIGIGFVLMIYSIVTQFTIVNNYSIANDVRIEQINSLNKTIQKDTLIILPKLPKSGMVYSTEITADTNHFTNRELRLGYNLKYHVVVNQ
jgi:hypothetical protein